MREPIENILLALKDTIEKGEYQLIIGDDASGRIPTLVFHKILTALYQKYHYPKPHTRFFAGESYNFGQKKFEEEMVGQIKQRLLEYIREYGEPKRVLVVTEAIVQGRRLHAPALALKKAGLPFDIATIGLVSVEDKKVLEDKLGAKIFEGMNKNPMIYNAKKLSGVEKDYSRQEDLRPMLYTKPVKGSGERKNEARKDTKILAEELIEWYGKNVAVKEE